MNQKKVILITGGSGGIGRAAALAFAKQGHCALAIHHSAHKESAVKLQNELKAMKIDAELFQADLTDTAQCKKLVQDVANHYKKIDVLVNAAGTMIDEPLEHVTEESFHKEMNINVLSPLMIIQEAVKHYPKDKGGAIINVSSIRAQLPRPGSLVFGASKAALANITQSLSKQFGRHGIRVNAVAPGAIETELRHDTPAERRTAIGAGTALADRFGTPEEVADVIVFLASDAARWITGHSITVDGGSTAT